MIVNVHAAKTTLSKLIERAEKGEEVIIARAGKPAVRLTPIDSPAMAAVQEQTVDFDHLSLPSWVGSMKGEIWIARDIEEFEAELAKQMEDSPIFPPEDEA
jgi:prevent-host-death family protein